MFLSDFTIGKNDILPTGVVIEKTNRSPATPKKFRVPKDKKLECVNKEVAQYGFWVGKVELDADDEGPEGQKIKFVARQNWNDDGYLAWLYAWPGACDDVETYEHSRKCGMAKSLLMICLQDKEVIMDGGVDLGLKPAQEHCSIIVGITCKPDMYDDEGNPIVSICKSYIDAARKTKYQMMIVENQDHTEYSVLKTKKALKEFKSDPDKFISERGDEWFFCKCKKGNTKACMDMANR